MKKLRKATPRSSIGGWRAAPDRPDPLAILADQERDRIPELLPIRHERMRASAFAFYRGGAAIMAADLARIPTTGLTVQLCGDAHIANFGIFATPERNVIFDVNDFDETLPGPWEWDLMRLCASLPLAMRARGFRSRAIDRAVFATVKSYQDWTRRYGRSSPLDTWYARIDVAWLADRTSRYSGDWRVALHRATSRSLPERFSDSSTFFRRIGAEEPQAVRARKAMVEYAESLVPSVRVLLNRYHLADVAVKVVGVGSVGTHCYVALLLSEERDVLVLQLKEAQASVLESHLPKSIFPNHAERVVNGTRLMQAASDIFLGWAQFQNRDFYVRQLRDTKGAIDLERIDAAEYAQYGAHCGWTLARAHARSGDPACIAEYLGRGDAFAEGIVEFAGAYADQVERDYEAFLKTVPA